MNWTIYLSGEIHTSWRNVIFDGINSLKLPIDVCTPVTDHEASDNCGEATLGTETQTFWKDHKAAKINAMRTRKMIDHADVVVIRFGEQYRQWNAAFDAGYAAAKGKTIITLHPEEHDHALKEVDAAALAVARTPEQVVKILKYVTSS
ncbi:MAG: YtoQ family protein [Phycisphaerales bacterium]|nr:YtoQ family protein [Phycisphaerales bacterium]